tara:strand:- start:8419 stop:8691 length:273 start_codon:yes stop_codon:yes gene_type:complete
MPKGKTPPKKKDPPKKEEKKDLKQTGSSKGGYGRSSKGESGKGTGKAKSTADIAKEVGRGNVRAGRAGVEINQSTLKSPHDMTMGELFGK